MAERNREGALEGYSKDLPIIADSTRDMYGLAMKHAKRESLLDLCLVIESLAVEGGGKMIREALWEVIAMIARQGVLPRIVEIDRSGNPVERSQN